MSPHIPPLDLYYPDVLFFTLTEHQSIQKPGNSISTQTQHVFKPLCRLSPDPLTISSSFLNYHRSSTILVTTKMQAIIIRALESCFATNSTKFGKRSQRILIFDSFQALDLRVQRGYQLHTFPDVHTDIKPEAT
jgi:hypothetical protein